MKIKKSKPKTGMIIYSKLTDGEVGKLNSIVKGFEKSLSKVTIKL